MPGGSIGASFVLPSKHSSPFSPSQKPPATGHVFSLSLHQRRDTPHGYFLGLMQYRRCATAGENFPNKLRTQPLAAVAARHAAFLQGICRGDIRSTAYSHGRDSASQGRYHCVAWPSTTGAANACRQSDTFDNSHCYGTRSRPLGNGFVTSLTRSGGNVAGVSSLTGDLSGKRLEVLKEILQRQRKRRSVARRKSANLRTYWKANKSGKK